MDFTLLHRPPSRHIERMGSSEVETLKVQLREAAFPFRVKVTGVAVVYFS